MQVINFLIALETETRVILPKAKAQKMILRMLKCKKNGLMAKEILLEIHFAKHKTQFDKLPDGTNSLISFVSERIPSQYSHFLNLNINNLLTESEGCTGKYQLTEVLLC